jgi:O-acetyl-ADP-ribose deacetylase (regulator of RNase III)
VWNGGNKGEVQKLSDCYRNSLQLTIDNHCKTIAFPNISTGIYRFPKKEAAYIAVNTVIEFLQQTDKIETVYFVCFDEENYELVNEMIKQKISDVRNLF